MARLSPRAAVSLYAVALLALSLCPLSLAGLQAFFFTNANCTAPLSLSVADATYVDWQDLPGAAISYSGGVNSTCVAPQAGLVSPIPYSVHGATYNCDPSGGLYVAEWTAAGQCEQYFAGGQGGQAGGSGPDYVYTALVNGSSGQCMGGATYLNKSLYNASLAVWSIVFCVQNNNPGSGASGSASVSTAVVALAMLLGALVVSL